MTDNPLLKAFYEATELDAHQRDMPGAGMDYFLARNRLRKRYAYAIPTEEALALVAAYSPLVEIGAGTGYWAHLLSNLGADIIAYDIAPPGGPQHNAWHGDGPAWREILAGGPEAAARFPERTLLLVWPPYNNTLALDALATYGGERMIYIGEPMYGCTADDRFFETRATGWEREASCAIPVWEGTHDSISVWRRR